MVPAHYHCRSYAACVPEVDVAAADARGFDPNVDFAWSEIGAMVGFLCCRLCLCDPQVVFGVRVDADVGFRDGGGMGAVQAVHGRVPGGHSDGDRGHLGR